jgi:hypothetical protein
MTRFMVTVSAKMWPTFGCLSLFAILFGRFWWLGRGVNFVYFDPKDFAHFENGGGRKLPLAAQDGTFEALLKNYIDVMKMLVTVAAASIAFGATSNPRTGVLIAKEILAFSVLYGVVFSGLLQFFYDEYTQNVRAYTRWRYSLIQALGFSALVCFISGFFVWAFNLG